MVSGKAIVPDKVTRIFKEEETLKISLIGSVYKFLAKVLAGRLSKILDFIISDNQSAFVGGKSIHNGVVVLNEVMEEAKAKKLERISLKLISQRLML